MLWKIIDMYNAPRWYCLAYIEILYFISNFFSNQIYNSAANYFQICNDNLTWKRSVAAYRVRWKPGAETRCLTPAFPGTHRSAHSSPFFCSYHYGAKPVQLR
jgi:hypothetical protein